ncbi:MAG: hypothetical protein AB7Q42_09260 [Acidimicrobiia bacterium]
MKLKTTIAGAAIAAGIVLGGASAAFAVDDSASATTPGPAATERLCERAPHVQERIAAHIARAEERSTRLAEARAKAEAAGKDKVVARIDRLIERVDKHTDRLEQRAAKLAELVAERCD